MIRYSAGVNDISWVGCYISAASLLFIVVVLIGTTRLLQQGKYQFPVLNLSTVHILILQTMMIPVDITTDITIYNINIAKAVNLMFFFTMLGNFLPSLGVMHKKEFVITSIALVIVFFNYIFNLLITEWSHIPTILFPILLCMFTILLYEVLVIPVARTKLKNKIQRLPAKHYREFELLQVFIAYPRSLWACGLITIPFAIHLLVTLSSLRFETVFSSENDSKYNWWIKVIIFIQTMGIILGSITLSVRGLVASMTMFEYLNLFKVDTTLSVRGLVAANMKFFANLNLFKVDNPSYTKLLRKSNRELRQRACKEPKRRHKR